MTKLLCKLGIHCWHVDGYELRPINYGHGEFAPSPNGMSQNWYVNVCCECGKRIVTKHMVVNIL